MFQLTIQTDNAAFTSDADGDWTIEVSRILAVLAGRLGEEGENAIPVIFDVNGNRVGSWQKS